MQGDNRCFKMRKRFENILAMFLTRMKLTKRTTRKKCVLMGSSSQFRTIKQAEADEAAVIERICFPPQEACTPQRMKARIAVAADLFFVAIDKENGKMAGFVNGIATDESKLRDELGYLDNPGSEKVFDDRNFFSLFPFV